jgi:WXXGXW repeat (2 copies)
MMRRSILGGLAISLLVLGGCYMPPSNVQAPPPPPAAPAENVPAQPSPNYVWVPGAYTWQSATRTYVWVPGHWTVPPQGYVWVPGHWETQANGSSWVDGQWRHN